MSHTAQLAADRMPTYKGYPMPDNLARLVENVIHSIEDSAESYTAYTVVCGAETYQVKAIDSFVAERKGRKLFHDKFGFYPTHVSARMVAPVAPVQESAC